MSVLSVCNLTKQYPSATCTCNLRKEFEQSYKIVSFDSAESMRAYADFILGQKRTKDGYTALVKTAHAFSIGTKVADADLESIMVHIEKEAE